MGAPTGFVRRASAWIAARALLAAYPDYFSSLKEWPAAFLVLPVSMPPEQLQIWNTSEQSFKRGQSPSLSLVLPRPSTKPNDNLFTNLQ